LLLLSTTTWSSKDNSWLRHLNFGGSFFGNASYCQITLKFTNVVALGNSTTFVFFNIWNSGASSQVSTLSWKLFDDNIQFKSNLARRGIILDLVVVDCFFVRVN